MKEIQLTEKDLECIMQGASSRFSKDMVDRWKSKTFLCKCYTESLTDFCKANKIILDSDGKFYKKE